MRLGTTVSTTPGPRMSCARVATAPRSKSPTRWRMAELSPRTRLFWHLLQAGASLAQLYNRMRRDRCLGCGAKPLPFKLLCSLCSDYWSRRVR
jgi:hypothetical protein